MEFWAKGVWYRNWPYEYIVGKDDAFGFGDEAECFVKLTNGVGESWIQVQTGADAPDGYWMAKSGTTNPGKTPTRWLGEQSLTIGCPNFPSKQFSAGIHGFSVGLNDTSLTNDCGA
jgi:hypothetical protein